MRGDPSIRVWAAYNNSLVEQWGGNRGGMQGSSTSDYMFAQAFVVAIKDEGYRISHTYPANLKRWSFHAVGLIVRPRPAVTCAGKRTG